MLVTIIPSDNAIYGDGKMLTIDCTSIAHEIHAVQWSGSNGWIEYINSPGNAVRANEAIDTLDAFTQLLDNWTTENARIEAEAAARLKLVTPPAVAVLGA
jgi:hypothetical protein